MVVTNFDRSSSFDFDYEANMAAVNEVCSEKDPESWKTCTIEKLCSNCDALATSIKRRLVRAFEAGRLSAQSGDHLPIRDAIVIDETGPDIPGGGAT